MRTREQVRRLLKEGRGTKEIARILAISPGTVCYHQRRLAYPLDERFTKRYDWPAIQEYYDAGHSKRECARRFGFSAWAWSYAVKRGAIVTRPYPMPLLSLELHHKNGDRHDNRPENLALLCPNCHSQTDTWGGKNKDYLQAMPAH